MKKRFTAEQIIGLLREADKGMAVKKLGRKHGFSAASYYLWHGTFGGMDVSDAKRLSERRGLRVVRMSASALRYEPRPDRNPVLRERIVALAQRHRRYGVGMIYLKLRQAGELVNYKRVERLYRLEKLHIRRRSPDEDPERGLRAVGPTPNKDPFRQRPGVHWQGDADLGVSPGHCLKAH